MTYQSVLESARNTAGDIITSAQSLLKAASYLPHSLREGATRAVHSATSVLESLRKVGSLLQLAVKCMYVRDMYSVRVVHICSLHTLG